MRAAADEIVAITSGLSLGSFLASKPLRWSIERGFEIIGEALTQLRKIDAPTAEQITGFRKIISFRNILIHGYSGINDDNTWDIVQRNLPLLRRELA